MADVSTGMPDGSNLPLPMRVTADGVQKMHLESLLAGENQTLGVMQTAPIAEPYRVTSTATVITGPCVVYGFTCTAGTNPRLALYDGTSTSGILLYGAAVDETLGGIKMLPGAIYCATGLHAVIAGTGSPGFTVFALA